MSKKTASVAEAGAVGDVPKPATPKKVRTKPVALEAAPLDNFLEHFQLWGIYPLNTPGFPLPGPGFRRFAADLGDTQTLIGKLAVNELDVKGKPIVRKRDGLVSVGERLIGLHQKALRAPGFEFPVKLREGVPPITCPVLTGHIWGENIDASAGGASSPVSGPQKARVMVLGKLPQQEDFVQGRNLVGSIGELLLEVLRQNHVKGVAGWYVTNLVKFEPPDGGSSLRAPWIADCLPLLYQELAIVQPEYIMCLGADASKAILGKEFGVDAMDGRVIDFMYPAIIDGQLVSKTARVMTVLNPAAVARSPDMRRQLERGIARFKLLQEGIDWDKVEIDVDHRTIRTLEELEALLEEVNHDPLKNDHWIGVDAEWHGEHPQNKNAYVRTIQFAWRRKHAAAIVWRDTEGAVALKDAQGRPALARATQLLNKFFANKRITGHFLQADLEWLLPLGLSNLRRNFLVPLQPKLFDAFLPWQQRKLQKHMPDLAAGSLVAAFARTWVEGGWDTGLAAHAVEETAKLGLEVLATRYTTAPRYDLPLEKWIAAYCRDNKLNRKKLAGYGPVPDEILCGSPAQGIPSYGAYDADVALRLMYIQQGLVDRDYEGNSCRESFWESMLTVGPILEMHQVGLMLDVPRTEELIDKFSYYCNEQEGKIREFAKWPDFNIDSVNQVREYLFGARYNGTKTKDGQIRRLRPEAAVSLELTPLVDTGKPPRQWAEIKERNEEHLHNPGTGKSVLAILSQESEEALRAVKDRYDPVSSVQPRDYVQWIRDYRFLRQVVKSVLRPPIESSAALVEATDADEDVDVKDGVTDTGALIDGTIVVVDDNMAGMLKEADGGILGALCDDGRIRTHFYPTTETKRWRSARPAIQNWSKRRDPDYCRLLGGHQDDNKNWVGGDYRFTLRSLFYALPGHVLIEADYIGAELYLTACMTGDPKMIEHATRNQLHDSDPLFYDIHSNIAVVAFNLKCPPTKKGLKSIGKQAMRVAAKNVIFGMLYGRSAKAIAFQCREEGNPIGIDEAQQIIDTIFQLYPGLKPFFDECRRRAVDERWICSAFGAYRRFPYTTDRKMAGEFERQAMNFTIQSGIASCIDRALANMMYYRDSVLGDPALFKFAAQMHDAALWHVPYANVEFFMESVISYAMSDCVEIWPTTLDGAQIGKGPYKLGTDREVYHHWGEHLTQAFCAEHNIPLKYAAKPGQ